MPRMATPWTTQPTRPTPQGPTVIGQQLAARLGSAISAATAPGRNGSRAPSTIFAPRRTENTRRHQGSRKRVLAAVQFSNPGSLAPLPESITCLARLRAPTLSALPATKVLAGHKICAAEKLRAANQRRLTRRLVRRATLRAANIVHLHLVLMPGCRLARHPPVTGRAGLLPRR
jgi:hypothetical protein